jgi:hypothetical protein
MPELLKDGLPERTRHGSQHDFARWANGQAWKFVKGEDYTSTTETFRASVRRWAREHDLQVELRPYPALDADGEPLPLTKADADALGVRFVAEGDAAPLKAAA